MKLPRILNGRDFTLIAIVATMLLSKFEPMSTDLVLTGVDVAAFAMILKALATAQSPKSK